MDNINALSANKTYNVTTNGTVTIPVPANPTAKLILLRIIINGKAGSGGTATIYDSNETLGDNVIYKKGTLDTVNNIGHIDYGFPMYNGIYIVVGGGTAPDLTIVYKETP